MKKIIFIVLVMFFGSGIAFSQENPGTRKSQGDDGVRSIKANGLTELYSVTGNYTLSADGAGSISSNYTIDVDKPNASSVVHKAYFLGIPTWNMAMPLDCVSLAGTNIVWDGSVINTAGSQNYYKDVTALVSPIIDAAAAGITSLSVTECAPYDIDGVSLLVIFSDPAANEKTIVIMFGGLSSDGDDFSLTLSEPIDPDEPGAVLDMGLGIEFGYQGNDQYSIIDVNGQRLTTSAGGGDDAQGFIENGSLITVGGIGDSNTNPSDPYALPVNHFSDDELYSLLPLITNTTTNILVTTVNPSDDDNVFMAYFEISGAAIIGEGILLSQTINNPQVGNDHTIKALVQDDFGNPVIGRMVNFEVISGPNTGIVFSEETDVDGEAFFVYSSGAPGTDLVQACFENSQGDPQCSNILSVNWWAPTGPVIEVTPLSLSESLYPDETSSQFFTIANNGDEVLDFTLEDVETSKRLKIKSVKKSSKGDFPDDYLNYLNGLLQDGPKSVTEVAWLSEDPLMGSVLPGEEIQIEVGFDATGLDPDIYSAQILVNSNDPVSPQVIVAVTLEVMSTSCSYLTTTDNENNALQGIPDGDMDNYLCNDSPLVPIEFNIFIDEPVVESAQLSLYAWDVDETGNDPGYPEVDEVYVNGNYVGALTGANSEWSTSVFNVDPSFLNPGPDGQNLIQVFVSVLGPYWCVEIDWGQLIINNCMGGNAWIRYVDLDKAVYMQGDDVEITVEVDTDIPSQDVIIETNLLDENMINVAGTSNTITIQLEEDEPLTQVLTLPGDATLGATYHAQVIVYDANTFLQQDLALVPFLIWDESGLLNCLEPGWQIISSCFNPSDPNLDVLMADLNAAEALVIMLNLQGFYWPSQNINLIGDWDCYSGYKVKMVEPWCIMFDGDEVADKTALVATGVNYLPVLSTFPVAAADIFDQFGDDMLYAFDIQNSLVYWPDGGIYTLNTLHPGIGYLVSMLADGSTVFPETDATNPVHSNTPQQVTGSPWEVVNTGIPHIISISREALADLSSGDFIAAFNADGSCVGVTQYQAGSENLALVVYGDDFTTEAVDGMSADEPIQFEIYNPATEVQQAASPVWDLSMPQTGYFAEYGASAVTDFKMSAASVGDDGLNRIHIYPNPSSGTFHVNGIETSTQISVTNAAGQVIHSFETDQPVEIDLSEKSQGVYYLRLINNNGIRIEKILIR